MLGSRNEEQLAERLRAAGYTTDGVTELLGAQASAALGRGDVIPALRATTGGTAVETLVRLFLCGTTERAAAVRAALGDDPAVAGGMPLVTEDADGCRAALDLRPYGDEIGDWWVLSDVDTGRRVGPLAADHVLGIGGASVTLAAATVRRPARDALDLGTGCGIQALHLSRHCDRIVATDTNPRALALAAANARLNGLEFELREGDLTAPVRDEKFDLIVSNPPFVVSAGATSHAYRDSGRPGDGVLAELLATAPRLLRPGGWLQLLGNWLHVAGEDWRDRVRGWLPNNCDAWVIQREFLDPAEYVAMWSTDAGQNFADDQRRGVEWLDWFAANDVDGVGFGLISVHATESANPQWIVEDLRQPVEHPLGVRVREFFDRMDALRDNDPLDLRLIADESIRLRQDASRGPDGWQVDNQTLTASKGLCASHHIDPYTALVVAGCDGRVPITDLVGLVAGAYDIPAEELATTVRPAVRSLVRHGLLHPVTESETVIPTGEND